MKELGGGRTIYVQPVSVRVSCRRHARTAIILSAPVPVRGSRPPCAQVVEQLANLIPPWLPKNDLLTSGHHHSNCNDICRPDCYEYIRYTCVGTFCGWFENCSAGLRSGASTPDPTDLKIWMIYCRIVLLTVPFPLEHPAVHAFIYMTFDFTSQTGR